jgi:1-deoxy-D-xylulose-5-phosphate synthase
LLHTALTQNNNPFVIRYPKDSCVEFSENLEPEVLEIGSWIKIREGNDIAILSVGTMTNVAEKAIEIVAEESISPTLIHAQFIRPFNESLLKEIVANYNTIITIEENALSGGFGSMINSVIAKNKWDINTVSLGLPDHFIEQGHRDLLLKNINLDPGGIAAEIRKAVHSK